MDPALPYWGRSGVATMSSQPERSSFSSSGQPRITAATREVIQRIEAEYREMPGLMLTARQAQRLWRLDTSTCASALGTLLQRGFLKRRDDGTYVQQRSE
jgi:Fic family protein